MRTKIKIGAKMDLIEDFQTIRDTFLDSIDPLLDMYATALWDPCSEYIIKREIVTIAKKIMLEEFSHFPRELLPRFKIKRTDDGNVEIMIQEFFNKAKYLEYIGTFVEGGCSYDAYLRPNYGLGNFMLVVRYGNDPDSYMMGGQEAEESFNSGERTILALAYSIALEDGVLNEKNYGVGFNMGED